MTFEEQRDQLGCARFALTNSKRPMLSWDNVIGLYPAYIKYGAPIVDEAVGLKASPHNWYATPDAIGLNELSFEVWERDAWRRGNLDSIANQLNDLVPEGLRG